MSMKLLLFLCERGVRGFTLMNRSISYRYFQGLNAVGKDASST